MRWFPKKTYYNWRVTLWPFLFGKWFDETINLAYILCLTT
jgi:hypothetical protein